MTPYILKKQFADMGGSITAPSRDQMEKVILLLEERVLAVAPCRAMARKKALQRKAPHPPHRRLRVYTSSF